MKDRLEQVAAAILDGTPVEWHEVDRDLLQSDPMLLEQLKVGGRLTAIVGQEPVMRALLITRTGEQAFHRVEMFDTVAPRLDHFAEPPRFRF